MIEQVVSSKIAVGKLLICGNLLNIYYI
jgi:hypothetical protein